MNKFYTLTSNSDCFDKVRSFSDQYNRPNCSTFNKKFFHWQYNKYHVGSEDPEDNGFYVIEKDGVVASYCSSSNNKFIINEKVISGRFIQEWFSSPEYSGLGLSLLFRHLEKAPIIFVMGASVQNLNIFFRLRKFIWFELSRLVCIFDESTTATLSKVNGTLGEGILQAIKYDSSAELHDYYKVKEIDSYDEKYDTFWNLISPQYLFCQARDSEFMNWRYVDHPIFDYKRWVVLKGDQELVHIVWRKELEHESGIYVGRIVEVIGIHSEVKEAMPTLLAAFAKEQLAFADFFCSNSSLVSHMVKGGFTHNVSISELDIPRLFSPLHTDFRRTINVLISMETDIYIDELADSSSFYITKGDGNQDRPNP